MLKLLKLGLQNATSNMFNLKWYKYKNTKYEYMKY